jgi:MFS family permease
MQKQRKYKIMDKQKIARQVEALAEGFIGIFILSLGTSYFQERFLYRVPRILIPVFDLFGNVGLAIGMIILGGGILYYGFTLWKSVSASPKLYLILALIGLIAGLALANIELNPNKSAEIQDRMEETRAAQIDALRDAPLPSFDDPALNDHLAAFPALLAHYEQTLQSDDPASVGPAETALSDWMTQTAAFLPSLDTDKQVELAQYQAKLAIQWNDVREKYAE